MFNPDGSEFERSGNGLRIAGVFLTRRGLVSDTPFPVTVGGSRLWVRVTGPDAGGVYDAGVDMGTVTFPEGPPFLAPGRAGPEGRCPLTLSIPGKGEDARSHKGAETRPRVHAARRTDVPLEVIPVSVGNPHAVVFRDSWASGDVARLGPWIAGHEVFPQGTNVQFASVLGGREIAIRIWERGVGRTSSSGTSACAAAAAAVKTGRMPAGRIQVRMEGGSMEVEVAPDGSVRLRGPVEEVCIGELAAGFCAGETRAGEGRARFEPGP